MTKLKARSGVFLWALFCLVIGSPVLALAQGPGVIHGQVINGTSGGGSTEGLEVVLRAFQGSSEAEPLTVIAGAQGQFRFEGLETGDDWSYLAQVRYKDVVYSKGLLSFERGQSEIEIPITVYEATDDDSEIDIVRAHILLTPSDTGLSVTEVYVFQNPTDRTYVGTDEISGRRWTSRFALPEGSQDLSFDDGSLGGRFLSIEGGFVDTEPQWPGTTSVVYAYRVDCPNGVCDLTRQVIHPVSNLNALIPDVGSRIESQQLMLQGKQDTQEGSFLNYIGQELASGKELELRVRLPQAASAPAATTKSDPQILPWIVLGGVIAALFIAYPFWKRRVQAAAREDQ